MSPSLPSTKKLFLITSIFVIILSLGVLMNYDIIDTTFLYGSDNNIEVNDTLLDTSCVLPNMPPLKRRTLSNRYQLSCNQNPPNPVTIKRGKFKLISSNTNCTFRTIISINDKTKLNSTSVPIKDGDPIPNDYFRVYCFNASSDKKFEIKVVAVKPQIATAQQRANRANTKQKPFHYNVAMLGFDSMSRISFIENLPKVYDLFTEKTKGVVFEKHMVVCDGSTPNLVAATAGQSVKSLTKKFKSADDIPLIFKSFQNAGYMTLFFEDTSKPWGTYQKYIGGFRKTPPIDHFLRPFYVEGFVNFGCLGSVPTYKMYMNLLEEMYDVYNKTILKFPFIFQVQCSHDKNRDIQSLEDDLVDVLKGFQSGGKFDNTILFLFSDHGARYSSKRSTLTGKYEERLPFLGIYLPDSLQKQRPDLLQILQINSKQLTSQFDLYATLKHILGENTESNYSLQSKSLFNIIPKRSCKEAGIDDHWCVCHTRKFIPVDNERIVSAAKSVIAKINEISSGLLHICSRLSLNDIKEAQQFHVNQGVLEFNRRVRASEIIYLITFSTTPGDALFESTVVYDINKMTFTVRKDHISRINRYARWVKCLKKKYVDMRKFCICKDTLKS